MAENTQTAKLRVMEEANFRELYHRYQYIECPDDMDALKSAFTVMEGATGILTYCYIEEGLGLSFYILCSAKMDGTELEAGPDVTEQMARVRYGDVCYKKFLDQGELDVDWSAFDGIAAQTREQFETKEGGTVPGIRVGEVHRLRRDGDSRRTAGSAETGFRPAEGRCDYLPDGAGRGQNLPDVGAGRRIVGIRSDA